jgi:hypothetical protein
VCADRHLEDNEVCASIHGPAGDPLWAEPRESYWAAFKQALQPHPEARRHAETRAEAVGAGLFVLGAVGLGAYVMLRWTFGAVR